MKIIFAALTMLTLSLSAFGHDLQSNSDKQKAISIFFSQVSAHTDLLDYAKAEPAANLLNMQHRANAYLHIQHLLGVDTGVKSNPLVTTEEQQQIMSQIRDSFNAHDVLDQRYKLYKKLNATLYTEGYDR